MESVYGFSGGARIRSFHVAPSLERPPKKKRSVSTIYKLTGKTKNRELIIENFQKNTNAAAFFISLKAGGTGITLTTADYVFLVDPWWNPAIENQAIDRLHRIGQTQPVFVYRLITPGTIEERVQELQSEKKQIFETLTNDLS